MSATMRRFSNGIGGATTACLGAQGQRYGDYARAHGSSRHGGGRRATEHRRRPRRASSASGARNEPGPARAFRAPEARSARREDGAFGAAASPRGARRPLDRAATMGVDRFSFRTSVCARRARRAAGARARLRRRALIRRAHRGHAARAARMRAACPPFEALYEEHHAPRAAALRTRASTSRLATPRSCRTWRAELLSGSRVVVVLQFPIAS